nr:MAG: hypothetical protein DIU81_02595 [[Clostridium] cellulosi]
MKNTACNKQQKRTDYFRPLLLRSSRAPKKDCESVYLLYKSYTIEQNGIGFDKIKGRPHFEGGF